MKNNMNNINIYNERMDKSVEDKLWFIDKVDADIYVDFGCANGNLLKHLQSIHKSKGMTNKYYIGYDNNVEMINIAKQTNGSLIVFMSNFDNVKNYVDLIKYENKNVKKVCLILSSVLHEVYAYSTYTELKKFWSDINKFDFDYIAIRDMHLFTNLNDSESDSCYIMRNQINKYCNTYQIEDFEYKWGCLNTVDRIIHFLLKYRYVENWKRELNENYFSMNYFKLESSLSDEYNLAYCEHYCLPYIKDIVKKDLDINFNYNTHVKYLWKKKA